MNNSARLLYIMMELDFSLHPGTVSFMSPAQNCIRYICRQKSESPLSGPPVHHIPIPAFHGKVQFRSNLYAQHRCCRRDELTQHCYFHRMEYSAPLKWWRSAAVLSHFSACRLLFMHSKTLVFVGCAPILGRRLPRSPPICQSEPHQCPRLHSKVFLLLTTGVRSYQLAVGTNIALKG